MSLLRRQLNTNITNNIETRDLNELKSKTGNIYESIAIIAKRANQINISVKEELHNKLDEFASHTDSLEEIHENKEQIEISRAYEKMPNPSILATSEFMEGKIYYRKNEDADLFHYLITISLGKEKKREQVARLFLLLFYSELQNCMRKIVSATLFSLFLTSICLLC